jgi:TonB family protein
VDSRGRLSQHEQERLSPHPARKMAAGAQIHGWNGPSRRRLPRFQMQAPLDVTVLRSGIPDTVPGRAMNVCERGIAVVVAGELVPGESVGVEVRFWPATEPLRTRATVRYQDRLRCGLEFVALSADQQMAIRDWAKATKVEAETSAATPIIVDQSDRKEVETVKDKGSPGGQEPPQRRKTRRRGVWWLVAFVLIAIAAVGSWWKWDRAWEELESGLKNSQPVPAAKARVQVPAEVMEKLLMHRVEPVYPADARKENLQGIIALDIVVAKDGSVTSMKALNGPEILANAAMDALRWWKFEPYRVNGEPAEVETTVAVEFKK